MSLYFLYFSDGDTAVETVTEQLRNGLVPTKVIGDTAYSDGSNRKALKENGTMMVAPLYARNSRIKSIYPLSKFHHDEEKDTLTCPAGVTTKIAFYDRQKGRKIFHFPMTECGVCRRRKKCTNASDGRRTVGISDVNRELREAEAYNRTRKFKKDMSLRQPIEGKISELKRWHGLRRARYRGLKKLGLQCYFTATAVNIKRWIKIMLEQRKPKPKAVRA